MIQDRLGRLVLLHVELISLGLELLHLSSFLDLLLGLKVTDLALTISCVTLRTEVIKVINSARLPLVDHSG